METENKKVLAMYDVRGIQNYVFRTSKLKHAIGASAIVENIIEKALEKAVKKLGDTVTSELEWENKEYDGEDKDIQVLYIGGGNSYVVFRDEKLYLDVTKCMAKYVLENTYSLQLAAACVEKTGDYQKDYADLNKKMTKVKADMPESKPIGALPVMQVELSTGLPSVDDEFSKETLLKLAAETEKRKYIGRANKKFDNFIEEKGENSTLAVIHIDGNNMGLRIRKLVEKIVDYVDAVNTMRKISYSINHSYKDVFNGMKDAFNEKEQYIILPVLTAGDDITYVCNAKAAIASMEYFVAEISKRTMTGDPKDIGEYGFSVCGGIAFIQSHFPFSIAYQVAEECCKSAKNRAKENVGETGLVGNFFDFQFCKNVQTLDIETIRANEYMTPTNEELLSRPFEISGDTEKYYSFGKLKKYLQEFVSLTDSDQKGEESKKMPRSHAKNLRNTYALGKYQIANLCGFLESRGWVLPDGDYEPYISLKGETKIIAKYYDALELMDVYETLDKILVIS